MAQQNGWDLEIGGARAAEIWCTRCDLNRAPDSGHGECTVCAERRERGDLPFGERVDVYESTEDAPGAGSRDGAW